MRKGEAVFIFVMVIGLMAISFVCGLGFANDPEIKIVKKTQYVTVPPTTYLGIKCIVNGYEVETDLASAEQAGCK